MSPTVVLCGSRRYKPAILAFADELRSLGVRVLVPFLNERAWEDIPEDFQTYAALGLTLDHFRKIELADAVYIFNEDGYAGPSTTLELGYSVAAKKPIYARTQDTELVRNVLYSGFADTPLALAELIR